VALVAIIVAYFTPAHAVTSLGPLFTEKAV
jgi:hypothetical protein